MSGVAVIMIGSQLGKLTGVPVHGDGIVEQMRSLAGSIRDMHLPTLVFSVAVLVVLIALARWLPRYPGPFIAVADSPPWRLRCSRWTTREFGWSARCRPVCLPFGLTAIPVARRRDAGRRGRRRGDRGLLRHRADGQDLRGA